MNYKKNCSDCEFKDECIDKQSRMYKGRCYIDAIAEKLKMQKVNVVKAMNAYTWHTGLPYTAYNDKKFAARWCGFSESQKKEYFKEVIKEFSEKSKKFDDYEISVRNARLKVDDTKIIRVMVAIFNFTYDAWRDGEQVRCMKCNAWMDNNSRHNRKYCDNCTSRKIKYKPKPERKICCLDCGVPLKIQPKNNKSYRCNDCQQKANKEATRIRVAKYREKKAAME